MPRPHVVVIGGGASGLVAAIAAARLGADVEVLEKSDRVGRKVLTTGNGRCNLSNLTLAATAYNQPEFVAQALAAMPPTSVATFFGGLGLLTYADGEGRIYPVTNTASSVLDVLRLECAQLGVAERCDAEVESIAPRSDGTGFDVRLKTGESCRADAVVVATGGGGALLERLGHDRVPCVPVLGPLVTERGPIRGLSGVRVRCAASLLVGDTPIATERGELLFRDYGVSGIMVFDLSRAFEPGCVLSVDLFPDVPFDDLQGMLAERVRALVWRQAASFFEGMLHDRVAAAVLRAAGIAPDTPAAELPPRVLSRVLKDFRVAVTGRGDARQAQVTRGGAAVSGFDPHTMQSRLAQGLFAAGEVLDVDGRCGGFNLHWAWTSGLLAGEAAARYAAERRAGSVGAFGAPT